MAVFEIATFSTLAKLLLAARKLATDTDPLNRAKALADLAQNVKALNAAITGSDLSRIGQEMEQRAASIDAYLTLEDTAKDDARRIFWQVAPHALADPNHMTGAALDPEATTDAMVVAIHASPLARDFHQTTYAENYFRQVMTGTLQVMLVKKEYIDSITPALWRQSLEHQGIQIEWLARLDTKLDAQTRLIETLRADLAEMKDAVAAQAAGVSEKAIFRLVQPIAENIADRDEALLALQEAVQIARRVQEEGHQSSNLGEFIDTVLRRVTALSGEGAHEAAISELDAALAQEEAESAARKVRLLTAAVDQHLLAFDAEGAAAKIARRVDLETPDPAVRFDALRREFAEWYERGRDKGLNLDLRVAIALAKIARDRADTPDQHGTALNDLGAALQTLGQRESGTDRLEEAVTAFRAALEERPCDRVPLNWAMTQMNLGNALAVLGERESGTKRLEEAVTAFRAALEEFTRDRVPFDWAMTQMNLGNALRVLGERESGTDRLEEAVAAFRAALEEFTRDRVPPNWAMTQTNLGNALQALGERESGTDRLEEAVTAFRAALEEFTRDRVPFEWAMTRGNTALVHITLFDKTSNVTELDRAQAALDDALEVFARAEASQYLSITANIQAAIDARRVGD